jgi:hypothetical protein
MSRDEKHGIWRLLFDGKYFEELFRFTVAIMILLACLSFQSLAVGKPRSTSIFGSFLLTLLID